MSINHTAIISINYTTMLHTNYSEHDSALAENCRQNISTNAAVTAALYPVFSTP